MLRFAILMQLAMTICLFTVPCYADIPLSLQQGQSGYTGCGDTYLDVDHYAENFGNDEDLVTEDNSDPQNFLVRFDLTSALPSGANVQSASLSVYYYDDVQMLGDDYL
ncbi:MAG: hypothetical protein JXM70_26830, partial [Pirellulales bacterium]|nr:hypothetical protein [Pirellulales bacterium]